MAAFDTQWYPPAMYREGSKAFEHHVATDGPQSEFGFKDFLPHFRMENFDPAGWVALFKRAGAQYVVAVSRSSWSWVEGHDYKSAGDIIAELADVSKNGNLLLNVGQRHHYLGRNLGGRDRVQIPPVPPVERAGPLENTGIRHFAHLAAAWLDYSNRCAVRFRPSGPLESVMKGAGRRRSPQSGLNAGVLSHLRDIESSGNSWWCFSFLRRG